MKTKRFISALMSLIMLVMCIVPASAADVSKIDDYKAKFKAANGPEVNGIVTDYMYFSPKTAAKKKYPLVIYFHGMGQGSEPGAQIQDNNIALWASGELQSRFTNGGAFIFVPRTHEEKGEYWENNSIPSVKAAIDEFIKKNKTYIDLTRIYVGGFSMGGKMTLKMATSYPDFFAAAFPMCPAYTPSDEQLEAIADMPVWLIVSRFDVIAGYYTNSKDIWERFCKTTNIPKECRLSLLGRVCYPDGKKTASNHHVWFAASNDLFMYDGSDYVNMVTTDANGDSVQLKYPNGLIKWLCSHRSSYNGKALESTGLCEKNRESTGMMVLNILKTIPLMFADTVKSLFNRIFSAR